MTEPPQVEQITKAPSASAPREKDPKRVAAGKALQVKNRAAKEELAKYRAQEEERNKQIKQEDQEERLQVEDSDPSDGLLSQLSLTNILSLVGVGLTVYALFFKKEAKQQVTWKEPVETTFVPQQEVKKDRPKFGM